MRKSRASLAMEPFWVMMRAISSARLAVFIHSIM